MSDGVERRNVRKTGRGCTNFSGDKELRIEHLSNIWHNEIGSLHLAYEDDELQVISEYFEINKNHRDCALLSPAQTLEISAAVNPGG